eukprot:NODE_6063_length_1709_cov_8.068268.p1 GENE.NODE_6063_length_1709_cov_8.068268~~NODE_6063_length_1709_cov_8.068268.p1  ORF type:complete len:422 (+),score=64.76 NODE_6063_length_1709_cov_8.068268:46-1266(+)
MRAVIILYAVLYLQIYQLGCFARKNVSPSPVVSALPVLETTKCEERFLDCEDRHFDHRNTIEFPYCAEDKLLNISGCMPFFGKLEASMGSTVFIPTLQSKFEQERESITAPWSVKLNGVDRRYVVNAEATMISIGHIFKSSTSGWARENMVGLLKFKDGTLCQLPCERGPQHQLAEPCDGITNTPWADYISLTTLLRAANVSLREQVRHNLHIAPLRFWGTALILDIRYSDDDVWLFWEQWGPVAKFVIEVRELGENQKKAQFYKINVPSGLHNPEVLTKRTVYKTSGLMLAVPAQGEAIDFGIWNVLMSLVIAMGVLKVSNHVVDSLLVFLYSRIPGWKFTYILFRHYAHKITPDESVVQGIFEAESQSHMRAVLMNQRSMAESLGGLVEALTPSEKSCREVSSL